MTRPYQSQKEALPERLQVGGKVLQHEQGHDAADADRDCERADHEHRLITPPTVEGAAVFPRVPNGDCVVHSDGHDARRVVLVT
eukprot:4636140-Prymnesium_polylepis.2